MHISESAPFSERLRIKFCISSCFWETASKETSFPVSSRSIHCPFISRTSWSKSTNTLFLRQSERNAPDISNTVSTKIITGLFPIFRASSEASTDPIRFLEVMLGESFKNLSDISRKIAGDFVGGNAKVLFSSKKYTPKLFP